MSDHLYQKIKIARGTAGYQACLWRLGNDDLTKFAFEFFVALRNKSADWSAAQHDIAADCATLSNAGRFSLAQMAFINRFPGFQQKVKHKFVGLVKQSGGDVDDNKLNFAIRLCLVLHIKSVKTADKLFMESLDDGLLQSIANLVKQVGDEVQAFVGAGSSETAVVAHIVEADESNMETAVGRVRAYIEAQKAQRNSDASQEQPQQEPQAQPQNVSETSAVNIQRMIDGYKKHLADELARENLNAALVGGGGKLQLSALELNQLNSKWRGHVIKRLVIKFMLVSYLEKQRNASQMLLLIQQGTKAHKVENIQDTKAGEIIAATLESGEGNAEAKALLRQALTDHSYNYHLQRHRNRHSKWNPFRFWGSQGKGFKNELRAEAQRARLG